MFVFTWTSQLIFYLNECSCKIGKYYLIFCYLSSRILIFSNQLIHINFLINAIQIICVNFLMILPKTTIITIKAKCRDQPRNRSSQQIDHSLLVCLVFNTSKPGFLSWQPTSSNHLHLTTQYMDDDCTRDSLGG